VPRGESRSAAEMAPGEKNRVSHRARALGALAMKLGNPPPDPSPRP